MLRRFFVVVDFSQVGFGFGAPFDATFGVRRARLSAGAGAAAAAAAAALISGAL